MERQRYIQSMRCLNCQNETFHQVLEGVSSTYDRRSFSVVSCKNCQLFHTNPLPAANLLSHIYANAYAYEFHDLTKFEKRFRAKKLLKVVQKHSIFHNSLLEIGSGSGALLQEAAQDGYNVVGCEIDQQAVAKGNEDLGFSAIHCSDAHQFLESYKEVPDVIVMSHVLEHILDPVQTLQLINKICGSQTRLFICVPNVNSLARRLFGRFWGYWQVPVHITHYNYFSIRSILENTGFEVTRVQYDNSDFLTLGSLISNIFNLKRESIKLGRFKGIVISIASALYCLTYSFGRDQMLIVAQKTEIN